MIRGQRFELNLDDDEHDQSKDGQTRPLMPAAFVADVSERKSTAPRPPQAPTMKHKNGFPEHQKRPVQSRFRQQQLPKPTANTRSDKNLSTDAVSPAQPAVSSTQGKKISSDQSRTKSVSFAVTEDDQPGLSSSDRDRVQIDRDNNQYLAAMTPAQREAERQELLDSISPGFLQKLLMRANIDSGSAEVDLETNVPVARDADERGSAVKSDVQDQEEMLATREEDQRTPASMPSRGISQTTAETVKSQQPPLSDRPPTTRTPPQPSTQATNDEHRDPNPGNDESSILPPIHFPQPTQPPPLDPSSPSFLTDLHQKYFPHLPANPSALSWTQPPSSPNNPYDPTSTHLSAGSLRFDFSGALIPPRLAAELPVTLGLHHHADAPDAAGYTLAELAHLSRSQFPAQRCVAFQTLGRVLWRLGRGEFGNASAAASASAGSAGEPDGSVIAEEEEDNENEDHDDPQQATLPPEQRNPRLADPAFAALALGLWREVDRLSVISILTAESTGGAGSVDGGRHLSAQAYATEALWLWRRSGGRRWKAA